MANLKEIRARITSVSSTMQITSAMKMVSAAKLKRATDAILQMRPYAEKLTEILGNVSSSLEGDEGAFAAQREVKNVLIVGVSSNRGLCGAFNSNVGKKVRSLSENEYAGANITYLSIGKKIQDYLKRLDFPVSDSRNDVWDNLTFEVASEIAEEIMRDFKAEKYDKVVLVYNQFKNAATQLVMAEDFLPIAMPEGEQASSTEYIFEPNKERILTDIIPLSLKTQLFKALLDSNASEHGARMTAMHKATDNATELRKELRLTYNKLRQASITTEILEIVSGANALDS
jgi:F-type H+-transporting ATPase subunit gamma